MRVQRFWRACCSSWKRPSTCASKQSSQLPAAKAFNTSTVVRSSLTHCSATGSNATKLLQQAAHKAVSLPDTRHAEHTHPSLPVGCRALIPMHKSLRLAGLLPTLDAPHHLRATEWSAFREAVVLASHAEEGSVCDVGLDQVLLPVSSNKAGCACALCADA